MAEHHTRRRLVTIQCGETTCASEPGKFCEFVRTSHFGTRWSCYMYEVELTAGNNATGWLLRTEKCLADFSE